MKKFMVLIFFLILTPLSEASEEVIKKGELLTVERCIEIALMKHPNIVAAQSAVRAGASRVGQAGSNNLPQIDLAAGYNRISSVSRVSNESVLGIENNRSFDQYSGSVTLRQKLLDFGKTSTQIQIEKLNLESTQSDLEDISSQVIFNVKQAYYDLLTARKNREVADETVKQFRQHLEQAKGFYEVGTKPKFDVTKAEVDLSNSQLNLIRADNSLRLGAVNLNNSMGVPDAPEYILEDALEFRKYDITFDNALANAYRNRPDMKAITARTRAAESSVELAKKGYYPILNGSAAYNVGGQDFPLEDGWNAGVNLTFPIFSGFLTKNQVEEAKANLDVIKANEELLKQSIFLEVQQAYLNLQEAEERISAAALTVRQAVENSEIANGRYEAGVGNPIEVTDAQVTLSNAKTTHIQALHDYKLAQASMEKAMGTR